MAYKYGRQDTAAAAAATTEAAKKTEEAIGKPEEPKKFAGLKEYLKDKDISFDEFVSTSEERRKTLLGKNYRKAKSEYKWLYDQAIVEE